MDPPGLEVGEESAGLVLIRVTKDYKHSHELLRKETASCARSRTPRRAAAGEQLALQAAGRVPPKGWSVPPLCLPESHAQAFIKPREPECSPDFFLCLFP